MSALKLQVNNSGAWKNVATLTEPELVPALAGADLLGEAAARSEWPVSFRVMREDETVVADWKPGKGWTFRVKRRIG